MSVCKVWRLQNQVIVGGESSAPVNRKSDSVDSSIANFKLAEIENPTNHQTSRERSN